MAALQDILQEFHRIAASPQELLKSYLGQGKKVVVCSPVYSPEEIIHSMGLLPFGTWGADMEIREAKAYFPAFICSIMQSILELGIKGAFQGVSAIVVPSLCDSLKCLGQNWKYAVPGIEFIPMTYPQNRNTDYGKEFTKAGYQRVIKDLERITGETFEDGKLHKSIEIYNAHNQAMREFSEYAGNYGAITAADRNAVFKSAYFMEKSEHTALVNQLVDALKATEPGKTKKLRVVTSGILADAKELLAILEDNSIQIVADDMAQESRQYRVDCPPAGTALDSLAGKFAAMGNCSVLYDVNKGRASYITELVQEKRAEGVIYVLTKFCDPEEFDYVIVKKACEEKNIPLLQIEVDRQMVNYEQVRTAVQTFSEMLG
ncbi:MAG TPA: 2-hydroxyacyl-CoA dehydratase [Clostridiales bacterium]|nr:2-hydroxyacyl-CoA dehydratase [Clostridiales bacterium]